MNRKYTCKPSLRDHRDWKCKLSKVDPKITFVDLETGFPSSPYDQKSLGSCVDNAGAGVVEFLQKKEGIYQFMPSRLYLYYHARANMGPEYVMQDSGSSIRDGVQALIDGFCS